MSHDLRSTQGVDLTNFDTILSILKVTYDKILLNKIEKWFIINIFHKVMIGDNSHIVKKSLIFHRRLGKKIAKMVWGKKSGWEWFCEISRLCTAVWKNEKFGLTEKIFRQINSLVICLVKPLLSRNFCRKTVRLKFHNFLTVYTLQCNMEKQEISTSTLFFRQINLE